MINNEVKDMKEGMKNESYVTDTHLDCSYDMHYFMCRVFFNSKIFYYFKSREKNSSIHTFVYETKQHPLFQFHK